MIVKLCAAAAAALLLSAGAASAASYTYTGTNFVSPGIDNNSTCVRGPCFGYATTENITGVFETSGVLAPNLADVDITPQIASFSFNDDHVTYLSTDPQVRLYRFMVTTNGAGVITSARIRIDRYRSATPVADPVVSANSNANSRLDLLILGLGGGDTQGFARGNFQCAAMGVSTFNGAAGVCTSANPITDSAYGPSNSSVIALAPPPPPATVPTLSEWAMIGLTLTLAGAGAVFVTRRRRFA